MRYIILTIAIIILGGCSKEVVESREYPRLKTLSVTNITETSAVFNAQILSLGNEPIIERGFLFGESPLMDMYNSEVVSATGPSHVGEFQMVVNRSMKKGTTYYVCGYLKTASILVYGDVEKFVSNGSNAPIITSISPTFGSWGDTIVIKGSYFSSLSNNVFFGDVKAKTVLNTDNLVKVLVPDNYLGIETSITFKTEGNATIATEKFRYLQPELISIYPTTGTFGDTVVVKGRNLNNKGKYMQVLLNNTVAECIGVSDTVAKFIVPFDLHNSQNQVKLVCDGITLSSQQVFNAIPFSLNTTTCDTITDLSGDILITVRGSNFNPRAEYNFVTVDGVSTTVISATTNELTFFFPKIRQTFDLDLTFKKKYSVEVRVTDQKTTSTELFVLKNKGKYEWFQLANYPGVSRYNTTSFTLNGKGYFGLGNNGARCFSDFYCFDPATKTWTKLPDLPGKSRFGATTFIINNEAYVGLGTDNINGTIYTSGVHTFTDFYKYDETNNKWIALANFPGAGRSFAYSFVADNKPYLGGGIVYKTDFYSFEWVTDFWEYNSNNDTWAKQADSPLYQYCYGMQGDNQGFVLNYTLLYKFSQGKWSHSIIESAGYEFTTAAMGSTSFIVLPNNDYDTGSTVVRKLNTDSGVLKNIEFPGPQRNLATTFAIGHSLYVLMGKSNETLYTDFYELKITE